MCERQEIKQLLKEMTLEEKAALLSGASEWTTREIARLDIPSIVFSDGPNGIRRQLGNGDHLGLNQSVPATCIPTASALACSWDEALVEEMGQLLGQEAQALGIDVLLGPGLNIKRSPVGGRNFEYFSEDPYLSGKLAASMVRGIQKEGVSACVKHLAVNSQELHRMTVDSVVDERTLREIYLTGFELAVRQGRAEAVMTSYNKINGTYANENRHLLLDILREEWDFEGMVVTDWGGSNDPVAGAACRSNVEMPGLGYDSARELVNAVEEGQLSIQILDQAVEDILVLAESRKRRRRWETENVDWSSHHQLARRAAQKSMVLLKNQGEKKLLPLPSDCKVAVIGDLAISPRYQGAGSSCVNPTRLETMAQYAKEHISNFAGWTSGYLRGGRKNLEEENKALCLAEKSDIIIFCLGLEEDGEVEGQDRKNLEIPACQRNLLKKLYEINPNIVGVICAGGVIDMSWEQYCSAIVLGHLGGQAGAGAVWDVLTGACNPSGRLSETWPVHYEDTPAFRYFPGQQRTAEYREGLFVGYRYYETADVPVQYPFGYGLSYTEFAYSSLSVSREGVSFDIQNVGNQAGEETAQLYVGLENSQVYRAKKELKGFQKVFLLPGEKKRVMISFDDFTFRFWNVKRNQWDQEKGTYQIFIGAHVADIRLCGEYRICGEHQQQGAEEQEVAENREHLPSYFTGRVTAVSDEEFQRLLGYPIPDAQWIGDLGINDAVCQLYYARSLPTRLIYWVLDGVRRWKEQRGKLDLNILFLYNIPFRGIAKMTHGAVSMKMAQGLADMANGHFLHGLREVVSGAVENRKNNREYEKRLNNYRP